MWINLSSVNNNHPKNLVITKYSFPRIHKITIVQKSNDMYITVEFLLVGLVRLLCSKMHLTLL